MATASQLLAKLKTLQYSGSTKPYSDAVSLIETTYRTQAYALLEKSVSEAATVGISIELKGLGDRGGGYSYVEGANIFMPTVPVPRVPASDTYPPMDIMTYFLFETRNATRAVKVCELRRKAALNQIASSSFAYFMGEYEARGGLELGEMWDALIKEGKIASGSLSRYAWYCYNTLYKTYPNWRISGNPDLGKAITKVLDSSYASGGTRRDAYVSEFNDYNTVPLYKDSQAKATCTGASLSTP
jgi:hypothetical protein